MSKLQEIRAAVEEYDIARNEWIHNEYSTEREMRYIAAKQVYEGVSYEGVMRDLLPIALAAEELRVDITFNDENGDCLVCGTAGNRPHQDNCSVKRLIDALEGLDE